MGIEFSLDDIKAALESLGISIPTQIIGASVLIVMVIIVFKWLGVFSLIAKIFLWFSQIFWRIIGLKRSTVDKGFAEKRALFVKHLEYEVERLNREADWNDFYYTDLEAEVELIL